MPLPESSTSQLCTLTPVTVVPEWTSQHGQVFSRLAKIECVAVRSYVDRAGLRSYVVEVFESARKNRIPTNNRTFTRNTASTRGTSGVNSDAPLDSSRKPIARLERRYAQFVDVRGESYHHAHKAHSSVSCDFCKDVIDEIVWGEKLSSILQLIRSEDKIMHTLAKSVNSLLLIVKSIGERRLCSGQINVPAALLEFLTDGDESQQ